MAMAIAIEYFDGNDVALYEMIPVADPESNDVFQLFTGEKGRGVVAGTIASIVANGAFALGVLAGLPPAAALVLGQQILGNLVAFILDIVLAKEKFHGRKIPYSELRERVTYMLKAFLKPTFFRFVLAVIIDTLVVYQLFTFGRRWLEERNIRFRFRDQLVAATSVLITYVLYNAILRFDWVYVDDDTPVMNVVVIAWLALTIMMACIASGHHETSVVPPISLSM